MHGLVLRPQSIHQRFCFTFGGKSLLQLHIEILKRHGIEELVLCVGYRHQDIERQIACLGELQYPCFCLQVVGAIATAFLDKTGSALIGINTGCGPGTGTKHAKLCIRRSRYRQSIPSVKETACKQMGCPRLRQHGRRRCATRAPRPFRSIAPGRLAGFYCA